MKKDLELFQFIEAQLKRNRSIVLLVVVQSVGSSPGREGFKMVVAEDGTLFGSIGGGVMEVSLVEKAKEILKTEISNQKNQIIEQVHRKDDPNSSGMICSGKQRVVFVKLKSKETERISSFIIDLTKSQKGIFEITENGFWIITPEIESLKDYQGIEDREGKKEDFFEKYWETIKGKAKFVSTFQDWGYSEKLGFKNNLYIIGGGHCALALSEIMSKMDFHITVFDDRPNLNTLEKNKFAHRVEVIKSYEKIDDYIRADKHSYVVVMTLGYKFDEIVIRRLFDRKFKYFGVLGSKAKMKTLLKTLEKEGFDKGKLAEIRTPIGLPINSHTPEEIAVSIAAEIISVKNS